MNSSFSTKTRKTPFIALHVGAGNHSKKNEKRLKELCQTVCDDALRQLRTMKGTAKQDLATFVAVEACKKLEDSPFTNAGTGSQLNEEGHVECDACIMSSSGYSAAVGASTQSHNTVEVCAKMLENLRDKENEDPLGRVKPSILVGAGADLFASRHGCRMIQDENELITIKSLSDYVELQRYIKQSEQQQEKVNYIPLTNGAQDTVGVICGDEEGNVTVCASSGGVALKHTGRIGPAAFVGPGVFVKNKGEVVSAACASGLGEDLITVRAAEAVSKRLLKRKFYDKNWLEKKIMKPQESILQRNPLYFGVLSALAEEDRVEIGYAHTTEAMIIAYGICESTDPDKKDEASVIVSRNKTPGQITIACFSGQIE